MQPIVMFRHRARLPSRKLIALIAAITLVPLVALLSLGSRLLDLDRKQENQRAQEHLQQSAQLVVAALQRAVSSSRQELAAGVENWAEGAVAISIHREQVQVFPQGRVAYFPVVPAHREPPASILNPANEKEYQEHDPLGAIQLFAEHTKSPDSAIRAGALLGLGRNLANTGHIQEALAVYSELGRIDDVDIAGTPASLAGLYLRCVLFEREKRSANLQAEARQLRRDLNSTRWQLTEARYRNYADDVARWLGNDTLSQRKELFEAALEEIWQRRHSLQDSGEILLPAGEETFAVLWQAGAESLRVLIAAPEFVETHWTAPAATVADEQRVSFSLGKSDNSNGVRAVKLSPDTKLPWDVVTRSNSSEEDPAFLFRRRLLIAGFLLLTLMTFSAAYLIYRAIARELAVVQLQSDFVAAVSHEFRTPLTSLRQFTVMLRENSALSQDRQLVCYDAQMRAADRLVNLVESLLDFGRMEAGARRYQFEQRDCAEVVRNAVEEFRKDPQAESHDIQLRTEGPIQTEADTEALSRAVRNLLENAVKYSPDDRNIEVALSRDNGDVRIAVRDHGIGIPANEQARVFKKFQRGEQARTRGIKGTGIGLAMVDEIVKAHHGHVELESKPGVGSTFTVVLPAKE